LVAVFVAALGSAAALAGAAGGLFGACSNYSCKYKGTEYHTGDTWTDGCLRCHCPPEGTKDVWCYDSACPDAGIDGGNDGGMADR
jgi:hypothetical protein